MQATRISSTLLVFTCICFASCGRVIKESGKASYYSDKFIGRPTANGDKFRQNRLTAASKALPFGTRVKVKNLANGKIVKVRINDRGPFVEGRIIDLTSKAARRIGMIRQGVAPVEIKYRIRKK